MFWNARRDLTDFPQFMIRPTATITSGQEIKSDTKRPRNNSSRICKLVSGVNESCNDGVGYFSKSLDLTRQVKLPEIRSGRDKEFVTQKSRAQSCYATGYGNFGGPT
jgi:hypothetical protein